VKHEAFASGKEKEIFHLERTVCAKTPNMRGLENGRGKEESFLYHSCDPGVIE
jgi:hypothetical protein